MNARVTLKNVVNNGNGYSPTFEQAWALYPKRPHNAKVDAWKAWKARLNAKDGSKATEEEMLAGVKAYGTYIDEKGWRGTEFVKMGRTFFGPALHFRVALEDAANDDGSQVIDTYGPDGDFSPDVKRIMGW